MMDKKVWASPPPLPPPRPAADLQSSDSTLLQPLQQPLMQLLHNHHPSNIGGGGAEDKQAVEHISTIPSTKQRNDCNPSSAYNDISIRDHEGGNWLEEDKLLPFKKRRILNLDYVPSNTTTILQREVKNIGDARPTRKCTKKLWVDHVVNYKDDDFKKVPGMINSFAGKDIVRGENVINNSTSRRCTRTSGKGWRCSKSAFAGYSMCEHHWLSTKNSRGMERKKKNNTTARKLVASKANITPTSSCKTLSQREQKNVGNAKKSIKCTNTPTSSCKTLSQREQKNVGNAKKSIKCTNKKWPDHVFKKDADYEGVADVMNGTSDAEKIKMEGKTVDNSTTRRCSRTNGKGWRCSKPSIAGFSMCEYHITARRNERNNNNSTPPREGAGSKVKTKLNSPTTLLQRENMDIADARRSRKCTNKDDDDDDFEGIEDVMTVTTPAAKRIKLEEEMMDSNITATRCIRSNGKDWRCSQPSFAGSPLCEYHWAAKKNWAVKRRKKKNNIPLRKAAESEVYYPTSTSKFTVSDTGLNSLHIQDSDDHGDVPPKRRIAAVKARSIGSLIH